jgi:hypothetical protein
VSTRRSRPAPQGEQANPPDYLRYDNLLQGPPMSDWAPDLDKWLDELWEAEAERNATAQAREGKPEQE